MLKRQPVSGHISALVVIESGTSFISSGNSLVGSPSMWFSFISSQYPPRAKMSSFFVSGKYKKPVEKLKGPGLIEYGKNFPYSSFSFISAIIFLRNFSYSSFTYCLFKMQYFFFFRPTQPKQYSHSIHKSRYSE